MGCCVAARQQRIEHDNRFVQVPDEHPIQQRTLLLFGGNRHWGGCLSNATSAAELLLLNMWEMMMMWVMWVQ